MNRFYLFLVIIIMFSCTERQHFIDDASSLVFSEDTIHFDTTFTSLTTTTRELRVRNPYKSWIRIDRIELAGGSSSAFRLNIDGVPANIARNVDIAPGDSIFIFIDAIIDPNDQDSPLMINDSIEFQLNDNILDVNLIAWGQDINLINAEIIGTETWSEGKPYLIYNSMMVDTGHVLTITEGARVLFHRSSTMYIAGSLIVKGTTDKPVVFYSDRTEEIYKDVPGQWQGLYFLNGSTGNIIEDARISQAVSGIHCGNLGTPDPPPDLILKNTIISHMSVTGLSSIAAKITSENLVIFHCGFYCLYLSSGGNYRFTHCTVANRWEYSNRFTPSVYISDYYDYDERRYTGLLENAEFINTVISGNNEIEIFTESWQDQDLNVELINCLIDDDNIETGSSGYYHEACIFNQDPLFVSWTGYDFRPDSLSPLIDRGSSLYSSGVPLDIRGNSRVSDAGPDIGAYEKQPGENGN